MKSLMGIKRRTGVTMPKHLLLKMAFDSGYEAGADDAGSGELLAEAAALRWRSTTWTARQGGLAFWMSGLAFQTVLPRNAATPP